jgi:hypothetical protein
MTIWRQALTAISQKMSDSQQTGQGRMGQGNQGAMNQNNYGNGNAMGRATSA